LEFCKLPAGSTPRANRPKRSAPAARASARASAWAAPRSIGTESPERAASHATSRTAERFWAARRSRATRHTSRSESVRFAEWSGGKTRGPSEAHRPGGRPGSWRLLDWSCQQSGCAFAEGLSPWQEVYSVGICLESARRGGCKYATGAQSAGATTGNRPANRTGWDRRNRFADKKPFRPPYDRNPPP